VPFKEAVKEGDNGLCNIELPPASQLDVSVLTALPSSICQEILEGYSSREEQTLPGKEKIEDKYYSPMKERIEEGSPAVGANSVFVQVDRHTTRVDSVTKPVKHISALDRKRRANRKEEIVVGDERVFLLSWKKYIAKLCSSSRDGLAFGDCERTTSYLCKLATTNLEMTELCVKSFRHFLELKSLVIQCGSAFNTVLKQVQDKVSEVYGGILKIEPLYAVIVAA
jgi:hypothetical protein